MHQFQNFKTERLPVIQNSKLKTQTPRASTARIIILQEETQTAVTVLWVFFHRRAQPSEKLDKSLFSMHLCSDYMNFDPWRAVAISLSVQCLLPPFPTGFLGSSFFISVICVLGGHKILKLTFHLRYLLLHKSIPPSHPPPLLSKQPFQMDIGALIVDITQTQMDFNSILPCTFAKKINSNGPKSFIS